MLVNGFTVILTMICNTLAYCDKEYTPNVGTVLFSPSDIEKNQWTKAEISLLRARRYFQTIIPPLDFINAFNEDYVNILLEYFRDTYSNIRREATDVDTDSIMTTALSDVVGGYLKVWVLPVAKLDYYGGTISRNNIVKLFLFYDELKKYLDTDGEGWHCPDENVLNSITINVAPSKLSSNTRSIKDACEQLAFFEKTSTGFGIPLPEVNWTPKSSTMFVPLKNVSLIALNDPDAANTLIRYYDTARSCIEATNPTEKDRFQSRFQDWLSQEIIPHLKDDDIYLALGSVLTLVNKTAGICNNVFKECTKCQNTAPKTKPYPHLPIEITSKKMIIIFVILLLEIAWCIPALIYILCSKRRRDCSSNVYLFIDHGKPDKKNKFFNRLTKNVHVDPRPTSYKNLQNIEIQNPSTSLCPCGILTNTSNMYGDKQLEGIDIETQFPSNKDTTAEGTGSRCYFSSKNQCVEATEIEYSYNTKRSALKKTKENQSHTTYTGQMISVSQDACYSSEIRRHNVLIEDSSKPPPKKNIHSKDTKPSSSSKRHDHNKEPKNISPQKQGKESKTIASKPNVPNKDSITISLKEQNSTSQDSKSASTNQNDLSQDSKASTQKQTESSKNSHTTFLKNNPSQDSKTTSQKTDANKSLKSTLPSKRSHQSKDSTLATPSFTKLSNRTDDSRRCDLVEVQPVKIDMPSVSDISKISESKMLDIEEDQTSNNDSILVHVPPKCSCTGCLHGKHNMEHDKRVARITEMQMQPRDASSKVLLLTDPRLIDENNKFQSHTIVSKEHKLPKPKKTSFKVNDAGKPFFEITIDRPATAISVDVTGSQKATTLVSPKKRSRIPKPNANIQQALVAKQLGSQTQSVNSTSSVKQKSMIPQLKKKTLDDIALTETSGTDACKKLNDTI